MRKNYYSDVFRYYGKAETWKQRFFRPRELQYIIRMRKCQSTSGFLRKWHSMRLRSLSQKTLIQIPYSTQIGEGFYIGHCGRIIINSDAVLGKNVNIATGVTIGQENRGARKGCPVIGNSVWIGTNAVIVGNIKIGDDVLIAPLTFVNFDIPSHSIVIGNPAKIIPSGNATDGYVEHTI